MYNSNDNGNPQVQKKDFVRRIVSAGYNVIPVKGKHPPLISWKEYQDRQVTPEEVVTWGRGEFPTKDGRTYRVELLNFGLVTGAKPYSDAPGIVVVDSDDGEGDALVTERCPDTPVKQRTGGRGKGWHRIYRRPPVELVPRIPNRQKTHLDGKTYNVDIRADGGYILCPGSIHPDTGDRYQEIDPWTLELIASCPVYDPDWIPDEREARQKNYKSNLTGRDLSLSVKQELAREYLLVRPGSRQGEGADNYAFALAFDLIYGLNLDPEDALIPFLEWGEKPNSRDAAGGYYPWTEKELLHKLNDAAAKEPDERGTGYLLPPEEIDLENIVKPVGDEYKNTPDEEIKKEEVPSSGDPVADAYQRATGEKVKRQEPSGWDFAPLTSEQFDDATYNVEWLVSRVLVKGQPAIVGGPKKSLKTNALADLALSLGSGEPFLGHFPVHGRHRTAFVSGETGDFTLQETARRICLSKAIRLRDADVLWQFRLPQLSVEKELDNLKKGLEKWKVEVAIIDPLYLCLLAGQKEGAAKNAANLFDMGPLLSSVANACADVGTTAILTHHARKNLSDPWSPLDLEDLAFSGIQEFARQWLLLSRRAAYQPGSGQHHLWLSVGGSTGHSGLWGVDVDEGILEEDFTGRVWNPTVLSLDAVKEQKINHKEVKKEKGLTKDLDELVVFIRTWAYKQPPTKTQVRTKLGWNPVKFDRSLDYAVKNQKLILKTERIPSGNGASQDGEVIHLWEQ